jgi:hypothetical protein
MLAMNASIQASMAGEAGRGLAGVVRQHGESRQPVNEKLEEALSRYLYAETGRRPLVHVVVK